MIIIWSSLFFRSVRIVSEYQRAVIFTFGKYDGMLLPGLNIILPIIQRVSIVDLRLNVADVPKQSPITKDNVSISVDAVIYYKVMADLADKSIIMIDDFEYAISQLAQTTMRNVIGEMTLDEVLSNRDEVSKKIKVIVDKASDPWGIKVESVELKEIILPDSLIRVISQEAEAEREKRAILLRAKGELESSKNLKDAATNLTKTKGALHLRTLQTIHALSTEKTNTTIYAIPTELMDIFSKSDLSKILKKK